MDPLKILIVEDNTITALDLRETLEEAGHLVTATAGNYKEAMKAIRQQQPDLAVVDIRLGDSSPDGVATAREIVHHHPIPIIYLTAHSEPETFQMAKETLPAAYLLKPFRHDELKLQIELAYHYFRSVHINSTGSLTPGQLYLPIGKSYEKVGLNDILYIKADGAYVKIFSTRGDSPHHISTNLGHLVQYFPTPKFYRLSRSLLINLDHLERLDTGFLYMADHDMPIPIPVASRKELMKRLTVVRTK